MKRGRRKEGGKKGEKRKGKAKEDSGRKREAQRTSPGR